MHKLSVQDCYIFLEEDNKLSFNAHGRLFNLSDIQAAKSFLLFLVRNTVTVLHMELQYLESLDSNTESFIYQIVRYFAENSQGSLALQVDGNSNVQSVLLKRLVKINAQINISFTILDSKA
jgi:hypothetical protein